MSCPVLYGIILVGWCALSGLLCQIKNPDVMPVWTGVNVNKAHVTVVTNAHDQSGITPANEYITAFLSLFLSHTICGNKASPRPINKCPWLCCSALIMYPYCLSTHVSMNTHVSFSFFLISYFNFDYWLTLALSRCNKHAQMNVSGVILLINPNSNIYIKSHSIYIFQLDTTVFHVVFWFLGKTISLSSLHLSFDPLRSSRSRNSWSPSSSPCV